MNNTCDVEVVRTLGPPPLDCYAVSPVTYHDRFIFIGGTSIPATKFYIPPSMMYSYHVGKHEWSCLEGKDPEHILPETNLSSRACTVVDDCLYVFGGSLMDGSCSNALYTFNFKTSLWDRVQGDGAWPAAREGAFLCSFLSKYLVLVGGSNLKEGKIFTEYWIYSIERTTWEVTELEIPPRTSQAFCTVANRIYMHGGQCKDATKQFVDSLDDIYELELKLGDSEQMGETVFVDCREIEKREGPQPCKRASHSFVPLQNKSQLILIGGETTVSKTEFQKLNDIWLFDSVSEMWISLSSKSQLPHICQFGCIGHKESIYIFGGIVKGESDHASNKLFKLKFDEEEIQQLLKVARYRNWNKCDICYQVVKNKNLVMEPTFKLSNILAQNIVENLDHPFFAVGLICDNALNYNASYLKIVHRDYKKNSPCLVFEDDAKLNIESHEYEDLMVNFQGGMNLSFGIIEKKTRNIAIKNAHKKQYGANLKIAGIRLGKDVLNLSVNPNLEGRISLFTFQNNQYINYFYAIDLKTFKVLEGHSDIIRFHVQKKYSEVIEQFYTRYLDQTAGMKSKPYRNLTCCFDLKKKTQDFNELMPNYLYTDLIYLPDRKAYSKLTDEKSILLKSIDTSLDTFLTMLYLKNEMTRITFEVTCPSPSYQPFKKMIINQETLDRVDQLIRKKMIYEVEDSLPFQFKIKELYLNPDLTQELESFHNGVLLYHKNRLIKRFGLRIGDIFDEVDLMGLPKNFQYFNLFGVLELPDSLEVNISKNDFLHSVMLQKLYSRLHFISRWFKENFDAAIKTKIAFPKRSRLEIQMKKNEDQQEEEPLPHEVPIKKKPNKDEDYIEQES